MTCSIIFGDPAFSQLSEIPHWACCVCHKGLVKVRERSLFFAMEHPHRIHGDAIYGNIYHQYTPFMLAYIPYMDPMGYGTPNIQYHSILSRHLQKSLYVPRRFSEDPARKTARNHFYGHGAKTAWFLGALPWTQEVSNNITFPTFCPLGLPQNTTGDWMARCKVARELWSCAWSNSNHWRQPILAGLGVIAHVYHTIMFIEIHVHSNIS